MISAFEGLTNEVNDNIKQNVIEWIELPFSVTVAVCANESYRRASGVVPWQVGDEKPEDIIRRSRGGHVRFD